MSRHVAVIIGRNEGDRLRRCLQSVLSQAGRVIYVDSGSTDGSVELARSMGVDVVELDGSLPFTAARARNAGFARLAERYPDADFVQFVDGDCDVVDGWIERGIYELSAQPDVAVVFGRVRERSPDASIYNRLCDIEWDGPHGDVKACGGISIMRGDALRQVGGFNENMIAGEEPELCVRLRQCNWRILRIDVEMTLHDASITRFGQWWKRAVRAGHAYAEGAWLHGRSAQRYGVRETLSAVLWGAVVPTVAIVLAWPTRGIALALLVVYPLQWWRIRSRKAQGADSDAFAGMYALFILIAKPAEFLGLMLFASNRIRGARASLIEYKKNVRTNA